MSDDVVSEWIKEVQSRNADLSDIQKDYYFGNYQSCINKANSVDQKEATKFYLCLSYCHLKKYDNLQLEVSKSWSNSVKLVETLANYIREPKRRDAIIQQLDELMEKSIFNYDDLSRLVISAIYVRHQLYTKALEALNGFDEFKIPSKRYLPIQYARIEILLLMNRLDLAERELVTMQTKDDFSTITQLAVILVRLASYKPKDAYEIAAELEDKNKASPLLKNLQTAAAISLGDYETAKQHCEIALDLDNDNLEALVNMTHILSNLRSSNEIRERNLERLKSLYHEHEFVKEFVRIEEELKPFIQVQETT